jgi:hypothetical protein
MLVMENRMIEARDLQRTFATPFRVQNDETIDRRAIYVCHVLRQPWPGFRESFQYFG